MRRRANKGMKQSWAEKDINMGNIMLGKSMTLVAWQAFNTNLFGVKDSPAVVSRLYLL